MHTILLLGASGAVGQQVLDLALHDPRVSKIVAPTRTALSVVPSPKLENLVINLEDPACLEQLPPYDRVICCLGTTLKKAGSKERFWQIDHDLVLSCARQARARGVQVFSVVSSLGSERPGPSFYLKTKASMEASLKQLHFDSLNILRPSLIEAKRDERRLTEELGLKAAWLVGPLLPSKFRPIRARAIARAILETTLTARSGLQILSSDQLQVFEKLPKL